MLFLIFPFRKTNLSIFIFRESVSNMWHNSKINRPLEASVPVINNPQQLKPEIAGRVCQVLDDLRKTEISVSAEAAKGAVLEAKFTWFYYNIS